jgi:hypothetical protein
MMETGIVRNDHNSSRVWQAESVIEMIFDDLNSAIFASYPYIR